MTLVGPILRCSECGAPVRFARLVEVQAFLDDEAPLPDPTGECIFHSAEAVQRRAGDGPVPVYASGRPPPLEGTR